MVRIFLGISLISLLPYITAPPIDSEQVVEEVQSNQLDANTEPRDNNLNSINENSDNPVIPFIRHRTRTHRQKHPICVNGKAVDGVCQCDLDWVGKHCEKRKHCESYRRYRNGSCPECMKGYTGEYCEEIQCANGKRDKHHNTCICDKPYSGSHCDELETRHIYSYYNQKVFLLGPLGALSLIPMCALYAGCEYFAKKRQIKRVGNMMNGQNIRVQNKTIEKLIDEL